MSDERGTMHAECDGLWPRTDAVPEIRRSREPQADGPLPDALVYELHGLTEEEIEVKEEQRK
jgi:hypothetical protein